MRFIPAHEVHGPAEAPHVAIVLHGILGSRRNWASFARRLAADHPRWRVVNVDLRNHGDSHGAIGPHTLGACARDLVALHALVGPPTVLIGHSFGGKVALTYARDLRTPTLRAVWALDAAPGPRAAASGAGEVERVIDAVRLLPLPTPDRSAVEAHFVELGFSRMLARWMTTNVRPVDGGLTWRFDVDAIEALLADHGRHDLWPFLEDPPAGLRVHVLRAGRGDRWTPDDVARLEAAPVDAPVLPEAGHWVHVDDPAGLRALLDASLDAVEAAQ